MVGEDLANVVAAAAEDGEDGFAEGSLERAAREPAVGLDVADFGLDGAAPSQELGERRRQTSSRAADQHLPAGDAMAAVASVDDDAAGCVVGGDSDLLQRLGQVVPVLGIARLRAHADDEAAVDRRGNADLAPELAAYGGLALEDAVDRRLMQVADLRAALGGLVPHPRRQDQPVADALAQRPLGDAGQVQVAAQVAQDAAGVALRRAQRLAHPRELLRVGVAADLGGATRA